MMTVSGRLVRTFFKVVLKSSLYFSNIKGNGWAAAGMLRVLATIRQSEFANTFIPEQKNLSSWIHEIHSGIYPHLVCFTHDDA